MKSFEYEIVSPKRLIKFDKPPDFRGKPRVTPLPSIVRAISGSIQNRRPVCRHVQALRHPHPVASNRFIQRRASARPRRSPPHGGEPEAAQRRAAAHQFHRPRSADFPAGLRQPVTARRAPPLA
ncbi:hypothetical protein [Burkholderia sp. Bp9143]|uniref:hypothetical protein n=1 Tax=Burkholderia sp. Bp9143 TaxID=2184574 RepID=UPI001629692C|nr:hypothetical protein [Burkholderia sp. Bp9143]